MKYLLSLICFHFAALAHSQIGYKQLLVSGGLSLSDSKLFSLQYEGAGVHKIHAGVLLQTIGFSKNKDIHVSTQINTTYESVGLYLTGNMCTAKNFSATWHLGGACGTNTHEVVIYPFGGLQQGWFAYPKMQLFISENLIYLLNSSNTNQCQPYIGAGVAFSL